MILTWKEAAVEAHLHTGDASSRGRAGGTPEAQEVSGLVWTGVDSCA